MSLAEELPPFTRPDHDEHLLWPRIRNMDEDRQELVRFMYSELECMCGSRLEGIMLADICISLVRLGANCLEVRRFVKPQHAVGWCRLDFFICPYRFRPEIGFAIECDGEPWHDAKRDLRRDAWLNSQGICAVYRFSGREIEKPWKDNAFRAITDFRTRFHDYSYGTPYV